MRRVPQEVALKKKEEAGGPPLTAGGGKEVSGEAPDGAPDLEEKAALEGRGSVPKGVAPCEKQLQNQGRAYRNSQVAKGITAGQPVTESSGMVKCSSSVDLAARAKAVKESGALPKAHTAGIPLSGPLSLSSLDGGSPFLQRPAWSGSAGSTDSFSSGLLSGEQGVEADAAKGSGDVASSDMAAKKCEGMGLVGCRLKDLGAKIFHLLLEVAPLRSQTTGNALGCSLFPLPTSRSLWLGVSPDLSGDDLSWLLTMCVSLNSFYGCELFSERPINKIQELCLQRLHGGRFPLEGYDCNGGTL